ncbi:hypothetical protein LJK88_41175 [Paenibacillus sp. P26]|nr:hypothetical protein LJK88_41175 [Paenibacillus sp. P26]UUZ92783.1 hypothetical protein LJK87_47140 [Paenibacillus sp. P25]
MKKPFDEKALPLHVRKHYKENRKVPCNIQAYLEEHYQDEQIENMQRFSESLQVLEAALAADLLRRGLTMSRMPAAGVLVRESAGAWLHLHCDFI